MSPDYFAVLGLSPERHEPSVVARRFWTERSRALRELDDPRCHGAARRRLDDLYTAYNTLHDSRRQEEYR